MLVELIYYWTTIKRPLLDLAKLMFILVIFLMSGTLPYLDNFSIIAGLVTGIISSFIFLPFVSIQKKQRQIRIALLILALPVLFVVTFLLFYMFYTVQTLQECTFCNVINCVPYTEKMCDASLWLT